MPSEVGGNKHENQQKMGRRADGYGCCNHPACRAVKYRPGIARRLQRGRGLNLIAPRYTIHADCSITRRKRFFLVTDHEQKIRFRSRYLGDILAWMDAEGERVYFIAIEGGPNRVLCQALNDEKELETWQN